MDDKFYVFTIAVHLWLFGTLSNKAGWDHSKSCPGTSFLSHRHRRADLTCTLPSRPLAGDILQSALLK